MNGRLRVVPWLFDHGAAEDVRTADETGETPLHVAFNRGHSKVATWLLLNSASNNIATGHLDESNFRTILLEDIIHLSWIRSSAVDTRAALRDDLMDLLACHSKFLSLFLVAIVSALPRESPLLDTACPDQEAPFSHSLKRLMLTSPSPCHLPKFRGHESSIVSHIADFAGVVRGRQLRNLREAYACF